MDAFPLPLEAVLVRTGAAKPQKSILVRRAQDGDLRAFEQLYRDHVGHVFAICLRMAGNRRRAEELTQDSFVRAWETLGTFRGESAFSSWLHRVAVNVVLLALRSERRYSSRVESTDDLTRHDRSGNESLPGELADLENAIAQLPGQARIIFVLHDVEGYKHEEIAEFMGLSVGTSKAQLHRARRLLRKMIER